jgi:hypothetical protein
MKSVKFFTIIFIPITLYCCTQEKKSNKHNSGNKSNLSLAQKAAPGTGKEKSKFLLQVDSLMMYLSRADTLRPINDTDGTDKIGNVNSEISYRLTKILSDPQVANQNIDSLLRHNFLDITHSDDKSLWIFSWYENTGGSFQSNLSMVYYKTRAGKAMVSEFSSAGASFDKIYKLQTKAKDLYLCIGSGVGCNTCVFNTAVVVELKKDSANFNYNAFKVQEDGVITYGENNQSCLTFGARFGDIEKFDFNPKTQTLTIVYLTDDNTPTQRSEGEEQERIVRKLVFNGRRFIGDAFE